MLNRNDSDVRSETYLAGQTSLSFQLSRTEAEHILTSGLLLSINAHGWLTTLCKDICTLMLGNRSLQEQEVAAVQLLS